MFFCLERITNNLTSNDLAAKVPQLTSELLTKSKYTPQDINSQTLRYKFFVPSLTQRYYFFLVQYALSFKNLTLADLRLTPGLPNKFNIHSKI